MLRRRGFDATVTEESSKLLLPTGPRRRERFYELLQHYSFRLLLRDVLIHRDSFGLEDLQKYCSRDTARRYLRVLRDGGLVLPRGRGRYRFVNHHVDSFGDTLEWLVRELLEREFALPALANLRVEGISGGGDFDVLGLLEGHLLYVETKAAPPRHIDLRTVAAFFDRVEALRPRVAIFVEDTKLRMKDKLAGMFEVELGKRFGRRAPKLRRVEGEVFAAGNALFLANAKPDLTATLGTCLRRFLSSRPGAVP